MSNEATGLDRYPRFMPAKLARKRHPLTGCYRREFLIQMRLKVFLLDLFEFVDFAHASFALGFPVLLSFQIRCRLLSALGFPVQSAEDEAPPVEDEAPPVLLTPAFAALAFAIASL